MTDIITSILFWTFVVISSLILFPIAILIKIATVAFDRRLVVLHLFTCFWASLYTWFNPNWQVRVDGRERIAPNKAYVIVCNHQSLVDILVLFRLFVHFKWVSKIENFQVPIVGWNMRLNRYIQLVRSSLKSQVKMIRDAAMTLRQGSSVLIFPEGTRSTDGQLRPFKSGPFKLALKTKVPLLPIVLNGSSNALPKAGILLSGRHQIQVRVLDEIPYERFAHFDAKDLTTHIKALIEQELSKLQSISSKPTP
jgi:1-acyl-sn-glycerol-3-phosphate acyltransferase